MGLDKDDAFCFIECVTLSAFNNKTTVQLLIQKQDKDVPKYLSKLNKLKRPYSEYHPSNRILSKWVVLPSE